MAKDMRSWISQLDEAGELLKITKEVDPIKNMGAVFCKVTDRALLFENIKGHPGWRVLGQAPGNMRMAGLAFGVEFSEDVREYARRTDKDLVPCKRISSGPVKEIIRADNDVDVEILPAHIQGARDAGRFIASGLCIINDPETGTRNMCFHRLQVKGRNKLGIMMVPGRHTWLIYQKYRELKLPMPIAIMIGHHPMYYMAAAYTGPLGMDEIELAGALLGEPAAVVVCETSDIEVPAHAEIILEGKVDPEFREDEGPFSEFQGYYFGGSGKNPVVEITAMTMRSDAIFKGLQNGPDVEGCIYHRVPMSAAMYKDLRNVTGHVELKDVYAHWGTVFGVVVQMTPRFYGEVKNVLLAAISGAYVHPKIAVAVDEDVNIYDAKEVAWAITTRVDPETDVSIIKGLRGHQMDESVTGMAGPPLSTGVRQKLTSKMIIDATKPPRSDPERRNFYERLTPIGLEDLDGILNYGKESKGNNSLLRFSDQFKV